MGTPRIVPRNAYCAIAAALLWGAPSVPAAGGVPLQHRVILIGLDGVTWDILGPLVAEGRVPNLSRCIEHGASGSLATIKGFTSPALWTTAATGRSPHVHGILDLVKPGTNEAYASTNRRVPAIWNILSAAGREVLVINYFATFPAESVHGSIVSKEFFTRGNHDGFPDGSVSPPETGYRLIGELVWRTPLDTAIRATVRRELTYDWNPGASPSKTADLDGAIDRRSRNLADSVIGDHVVFDAAEILLREQHPDFFAVHIWGTDVVEHLFAVFSRFDKRKAWTAGRRAFGEVVERYYQDTDAGVGRLMETAGNDAVFVIASDHGQSAIRFWWTPTLQTALNRPMWEHSHGEPGILIACGPGIRAGARLGKASLLDLAPTILHLEGLSIPVDMEGHVLDSVLDAAMIVPHSVRGPAVGSPTKPGADAAPGPKLNPAEMDNLKRMGYVR